MNKLEYTTPVYIRATNHNAFRSCQWAKVISVELLPEQFGRDARPARPVYLIEWVDGKRDQWPVYDDAAGYEFSSVVKA